jgi:hypothetical protein
MMIKVAILHPAGVADGKRAHGIAQGIIVSACGPFHEPGEGEQRPGGYAAYQECLREASVRAQDGFGLHAYRSVVVSNLKRWGLAILSFANSRSQFAAERDKDELPAEQPV